jgi:hypothetical protein
VDQLTRRLSWGSPRWVGLGRIACCWSGPGGSESTRSRRARSGPDRPRCSATNCIGCSSTASRPGSARNDTGTLGRGDGRLPLREPTAVGETKHSRETACCMRNVHSAARRTSIHGDPRRKAPAQRLLGTAPTPPPPRRPPPSSTTRARRLLIVTASGRRHDHLRSQGGDDVAKIDDLDEVRDGVPIVTDACEAVAVSGADAGVSAEDALDSAPPVNESQWVLLVEHVGLRPQRRRARMRRGSGTQTLQATSAACR